MKDNLENELECIMPNTQLSIELEVKELVIKKQESVTQECVLSCIWNVPRVFQMTLVDTDLPILQPIHYYPLTLQHMRKEGNAYAY